MLMKSISLPLLFLTLPLALPVLAQSEGEGVGLVVVSPGEVEANDEQVERLLRQMADAGDAQAQFRLAKVYFVRAVRDRDKDMMHEVVYLLEQSSEQEYGEALAFLGYLHMSGTIVAKNRSRAVYLWKRASRQGVALAQYNLGVYYASKRTRADDRVAMEFYDAAYRAGLVAAAQNIEYMQRQGRAGAMRERIVVARPGEQSYQGGVSLASTRQE